MKNDLHFEQALKRLEEIVKQMEQGNVSLEESLKLFEEGARLTAFCNESLKAAEQKITQLTLTAAGEGE